MSDTTILHLDSFRGIEKGNQHVILIQNTPKANVNDWKESPWIVSLLIPILVAAFIAWFANKLSKKKNKLEIDKLKEETKKLKKAFQPIIIGTLQSIQDKIIASKIEALNFLVQIRNSFKHHDQQYIGGQPITPDHDDYLDLLYYNFTSIKFEEYNKFHDKYSYLFPDKVFNILNDLHEKLGDLNEDKKSFDSHDDPDLTPGNRDRQNIEQIITIFKDAILAIRIDCHLDTSFIHEFIQENRR